MDHGPTTTAVAAALSRLQAEGRWQSLRQLSAALAALPGGGIKLSHTSIGQIVRGERHITVDELTSLATCLGVSPVTFLMPASDTPAGVVGLSGTGPADAGTLLGWLRGDSPLDAPDDPHEAEVFRRRALPQWAWERKESR